MDMSTSFGDARQSYEYVRGKLIVLKYFFQDRKRELWICVPLPKPVMILPTIK